MQNYTPLNLDRFQENKTMTFLLLLATITLAILAVVLFLFIQKKMQETNQPNYQMEEGPSDIVSPSPTVINQEVSPLPSPTVTIEPTLLPATPSPTEIINEESNATSAAQ